MCVTPSAVASSASLPGGRWETCSLTGQDGISTSSTAAKPCGGLGVLGECRLAIHVREDLRFHCYDHDKDSDTIAADTTEVESWLQGREETAQQPSDTLLEMASSNSWDLLKRYTFRLRVSWSDGYYAASVAALAEASFGPTIAEAVNGAAEMICHLFKAPAELASALTLAAELDETAVRRIRTER
jgi:hypothetical protein